MKSRAVFAYHTAHLTGLAVRATASFPRSAAQHFTSLDNEPAWMKLKREMARIAADNNARRGGA